MAAPSTTEELIDLIRRSDVVDERLLSGYLRGRDSGDALPPDPKQAADELVRDAVLTTFQSEQFLLGKWKGFTIGKYKILERVGVGGMGQVFLCEHTMMRRRVAIKVLPPAKAEHPSALGRFYREARAAGALEHRNIVRTHDIDQDGELHFIVMEFVDGINLLDVVRKFGPLDVGRATDYARQVAIGLDYAFRNGIIHRDVKPGNIMIDRYGTARILDLGLARFYQDQTDLLTVKYDDKAVLGTADYVAPEQVLNSHKVDVRADIYALGATFYFLLAGHPAFPAGSVSQKLIWHRTKDPAPIRYVRPEVPEGLAAVLTKMLAKDPDKRHQTPAELAAALEPWVPVEVPLPDPEEMPKLCPAASGRSPTPVPGTEPPPAKAAVVSRGQPRVAAGNRTGTRASSRVEVVLPRHPMAVILEPETPTDGLNESDATPPNLQPTPVPAHPRRVRRRPWRKIALLTAAVVIVLGLLAGFWWIVS
ncbi:MAG TPA: protein kinase [Fimbriiglobus sp.]|nr:protein kinase [Fimbriiglobus sp.]